MVFSSTEDQHIMVHADQTADQGVIMCLTCVTVFNLGHSLNLKPGPGPCICLLLLFARWHCVRWPPVAVALSFSLGFFFVHLVCFFFFVAVIVNSIFQLCFWELCHNVCRQLLFLHSL